MFGRRAPEPAAPRKKKHRLRTGCLSVLALAGVSLLFGAVMKACEEDPARLPPLALSVPSAPLTDSQIVAIKQKPGDLPLRDLSHYQARTAARGADARLNAGGCRDNTQFSFGLGIGDITGAAFDQVLLGYAESSQVARGIHDRQHARAFAIQSSCDGRTARVVLVQMDIGLMFNSIKQGVVERLSKKPALAGLYGMANIVLNASHSHGTAGGQAFHDLTNLASDGHDPQSYEAAVGGVVTAIERAHARLGRARPGQLLFNQGELLDGNTNRSRIAYQSNSKQERAGFLDTSGREVDTNRMMVLLKLLGADGQPGGMLNWYPVHGTSVSELNRLLTGDNKGYAAQRFERELAGPFDYLADPSFAAGFMQADEGDVSPNLFIGALSDAELRDKAGKAFRARNGARSDFENAVISGSKQFLKARELYEAASEPLRGEVAVIHQLIDFSKIAVTHPLRSYPVTLLPSKRALGRASGDGQDDQLRTCMGALGASLGGGAEDGRGPSIEGQTCFAIHDVAGIARDLRKNFGLLTDGIIPPGFFVPLGCGNPLYDWLGADCHAEKPVLLTLGFSPYDTSQGLQAMTIPLQIVVLGNLAVIALPWEVTTMSGRRVRAAVLDALQDAGVDYAVISGLSNDYIHYMTTREEYALQHYEGASTVFGPWTQEAATQELVRMAGRLRLHQPPDSPHANDGFRSHRTGFVHEADRSDGELASPPGQVLAQPEPSYTLHGALNVLVQARFSAGNPRNERPSASFVYIERQEGSTYRVIASDDDWSTSFEYGEDERGIRQAVVQWTVAPGTAPGRYRIRHAGASAAGPYQGSTRLFELRAP